MKVKSNKTSKTLSLCAFLDKQSDGDLSLLEKFDNKEIKHFCKLGFLTRGMDSRNKRRYRLTALGEKQVRIIYAQEEMNSAFDTILDVL